MEIEDDILGEAFPQHFLESSHDRNSARLSQPLLHFLDEHGATAKKGLICPGASEFDAFSSGSSEPALP